MKKQYQNGKNGLAQIRILEFGKKDNFWEMGDTGPCGPAQKYMLIAGVMRKEKNKVGKL